MPWLNPGLADFIPSVRYISTFIKARLGLGLGLGIGLGFGLDFVATLF